MGTVFFNLCWQCIDRRGVQEGHKRRYSLKLAATFLRNGQYHCWGAFANNQTVESVLTPTESDSNNPKDEYRSWISTSFNCFECAKCLSL